MQRLLEKRTRFKSQFAREFVGELFGTFILLVFGLNSVAQFKLTSSDNPDSINLLSINLGFGIGVIVAILVTGKASGY